MYIFLNFVLAVFLPDLQFVIAQSACKKEVEVLVDNTKITWPDSNSSSLFLSEPPCVNANKTLVRRTCLNGKWLPTNQRCVSVQQTFTPLCGDDKEFENYCFYIRPNKKWTSKTPVVDIELLTNSNILNLLRKYIKHKNMSISQIWLPVKRNDKYGKFVWQIANNYLQTFSHYSEINKNYRPEYVFRECMTIDINTSISVPEDCNKKHTIIHIYKPESRYFINTPHLFFSTSNNHAFFIEKNCTVVAEPKTIEDNFLIKKLVGYKNRTCRIGIEKDHNNNFIWRKDRKYINYTDWTSDTNFNNSVVAISTDGWKLENNSTQISCSICQVDHTHYQTDIKLGLNTNQTQLILTAYSYQTISLIHAGTIGLDDIDINLKFVSISVQNDLGKFQNSNEKLDLRKLWKLNFTHSSFNYYYLRAIILPHKQEINTDKIFFQNITGNEYAFKIKIYKICSHICCDAHILFKNKNYNNYKRIAKILHLYITMLQNNQNTSSEEEKLDNFLNITHVRPVEIKEINTDGTVEILLHLRTNNKIKNITTEYNIVNKLLTKLHDYLSNISVKISNHSIIENKNEPNTTSMNFKIDIDKSAKNCMGCINDQEHNYNWKFTEIDHTQNTLNCSMIKVDKFHFTRKCGGNHLKGAKWEDPKKHYYNKDSSKYSQYTSKLCNIYNEKENLTVHQVLNKLSNITTKSSDIKATDIYYIAKILQNITSATTKQAQLNDTKSLAENTTLLISNMLTVNRNSLEESNENNSTNNILAQVEQLLPELTKNDLDERGVNTIVQENFMHSLLNPFISNITGIALIRPNTSDSNNSPFTKYNITYIHANASVKDLVKWDNLDTAIFIPEQLLAHVKNSTNSTARISISIFYNDSLFIESKNISVKSELLTKVFNVIIQGYENYLDSPFPIISRLKNPMNSTQPCARWDFGVQSRWGPDLTYEDNLLYLNSQLQVCFFDHLTNFAFLLGTTQNVLLPYEHESLEIITAVGCLLSTIGICGIILTAVIFRSWRQKVGTKIILNVSACILLQIILLYFNMNYTDIICVITGSLLHYSVLCGFSWSLILAVLQYLKFVRVLGGQTPHLLLKASVVGWILPIIPVTIAIVYNYMTNSQYMADMEQMGSNICYPQGLMLYLTLILPVSLIGTTNLVIFIIIFYNVSWRPKIRNTLNEQKMLLQQIKLAIFLFFLLGLTWIPGLITKIYHSYTFLCIFTATASMQGFVLFIFYVLLDNGTRGLWCKKIKQIPQTSNTNFKSQSNSQQVIQPASNTFVTSDSSKKEESDVSLSEVAEWNLRSQNVMKELDASHRLRKK